MVLLKNDEKTFDCQSMIPLFGRDKENDCVLYSKDGGKFNVCKEVLYQTKFLRKILVNLGLIKIVGILKITLGFWIMETKWR